jgi:uncharacterized protein YbaP (TraB family)
LKNPTGKDERLEMIGYSCVRALILTIALLFFATGSTAGGSGEKGGKCFLWEVRSKTGRAYLLGSVHLAKAGLYPMSPVIEKSFDTANIVAVEADPEKGGNPELAQKMLMAASYTGNDTLRQHLSHQTYELAEREMGKIGIPVEKFSTLKPWFLALTIGILEFQRLGYNPEYGIDRYFTGKARGKKKIVELESFDYQINLLSGFTDLEQDLFLRYTIMDIKTVEKDIERLMSSWQTGDAAAMESIVMQSLNESPELLPVFEKLFYRRNREMAGKIEQFLRSGDTYFIVVGAAHLVGKESIIDLLRKKGYAIKQM